jgi:membrane-associated phospholipid phosphatase
MPAAGSFAESQNPVSSFGFAANRLSKDLEGVVAMVRKWLWATIILTGACGLILTLWPDLDVAAADRFYAGNGHFIGRSAAADWVRKVGYGLPIVLAGAGLLAWLLHRFGLPCPAPEGRGVALFLLTLLIGPGLLANSLLKDHSHRPRPVQIRRFGGDMEFRPWYRFDGGCRTNCSFVSGEAAEAFSLLAPASLTPPPLQPYVLAAAMVFGLGISGLRLAYGGHFLSDVVFAALLTVSTIAATRRVLYGPRSCASARMRADKD